MDRPKVTREMIAEAAQELAGPNGWDEDRVADVAKTYRSHMDGYELAKNLESHCFWDISANDVAELDEVDSAVREIHRKACLKWAKDQNIQPPLPIGTMTTQGEIVGIYKHDAACYLVHEPGTPKSRHLIVEFEDARAIEPAIPAEPSL